MCEDTLEKLAMKKDQRARGVEAVLEEVVIHGFVEFAFGFQLFSSFRSDTVEQKWFRECILNPDFGIPVLIYTGPNGKQWIVRNDGKASLQKFFHRLVRDDEEGRHAEDIFDFNEEFVRFPHFIFLICKCKCANSDITTLKLLVLGSLIVRLVNGWGLVEVATASL